jgi:hypothetical protein
VPDDAAQLNDNDEDVTFDATGVPGGPGTCPVPDVVITLVIALYGELPAEFVARTRYRYVVDAARPESLNDVVVDVPT